MFLCSLCGVVVNGNLSLLMLRGTTTLYMKIRGLATYKYGVTINT